MKIDETGKVQYYKVTPIDRVKWFFLALLTTLKMKYRNWDAERWHRKYGK